MNLKDIKIMADYDLDLFSSIKPLYSDLWAYYLDI